MFERYWKPRFDRLALKANERIERVVQSDTFLRASAGLLGGVMRNLRMVEQMRDLLLSQLGVAMRSHQLKVMHGVQRLLAEVEDLMDELRTGQQRRAEEIVRLIAMVEQLQTQVTQMHEQLDAIPSKKLSNEESIGEDATSGAVASL